MTGLISRGTDHVSDAKKGRVEALGQSPRQVLAAGLEVLVHGVEEPQRGKRGGLCDARTTRWILRDDCVGQFEKEMFGRCTEHHGCRIWRSARKAERA